MKTSRDILGIRTVAMVCMVMLAASGASAATMTWQGGNGNWLSNSNWNNPPTTWVSGSYALFQGTAATLTANGTVTVGSGNSRYVYIKSAGAWAFIGGTVTNRYWTIGNNAGSSTDYGTFRFDGIALNYSAQTQNFSVTNYTNEKATIELGDLTGSAGSISFGKSVGLTLTSANSLSGITSVTMDQSTLTSTGSFTYSSGFKWNNTTFNSSYDLTLNGNFGLSGASVDRWISNTSATAVLTLDNGAYSASVRGTKTGSGTVVFGATSSGGSTGGFGVSNGTLLMNGTYTNWGQIDVASGATLGGTGSIGMLAGKDVVVAGNMTADLADGLDIVGGLNLASTANLYITGTLDNTPVRTLMTFSSLTGAATKFANVYLNGSLVAAPETDLGSGHKLVYGATDITVVIPEPATMALLALGGLLGLRRRK